MSNQAPTLGEKIDALLTPFVQDESALQQRLENLEAEAKRIQNETVQAQEDLAVIQSAKINALRQAAESDPLLKAAFATDLTNAAAEPEEPQLEIVDEDQNSDGHPLLSHAS